MVALLNTPRHSRERQWLYGVFGQKKKSPSGACAPLWEQLQNTPQLIYMSLNKNSVYCVMPRSSKPPDTCKWGGPELRGILKFSPIMSRNFILACRIKFLILCDMIRSMSRSMIWSVIWSVIRSGPIQVTTDLVIAAWDNQSRIREELKNGESRCVESFR